MMLCRVLVLFVVSTIVFSTEGGEFKTVLSKLEDTFTKKMHLLKELQHFLRGQQHRLNKYDRNFENDKNELEEIFDNFEKLLIETVKINLLIKGLTVEWRSVKELLGNSIDILAQDNKKILTQYEDLCHKEIALSEKVIKELKCKYTHHDNPYLKIAPFKEEEVFPDPRIVIYYDVISPDEIEALKNLSYERLIIARSGAIPKISKYRVAQVAWIDDEDHKHVNSLNHRVEQITNLNLETAEFLQVSYYETGGYYKPHYDFDINEEYPFLGSEFGNRIATLMFYLTDVEAGGKTVFLNLNISITPKVGSAVLWYNLLTNGRGDYSTYHAACPVTKGIKWVANKWFFERGQEFRRPCLA